MSVSLKGKRKYVTSASFDATVKCIKDFLTFREKLRNLPAIFNTVLNRDVNM